MKLRHKRLVEYLNNNEIQNAIDVINSEIESHENLHVLSNKNIINAILFKDCVICMELLISEHYEVFDYFLEYIIESAKKVYFSENILKLLKTIDKKEYLFI
jgi:hypothetical protein